MPGVGGVEGDGDDGVADDAAESDSGAVKTARPRIAALETVSTTRRESTPTRVSVSPATACMICVPLEHRRTERHGTVRAFRHRLPPRTARFNEQRTHLERNPGVVNNDVTRRERDDFGVEVDALAHGDLTRPAPHAHIYTHARTHTHAQRALSASHSLASAAPCACEPGALYRHAEAQMNTVVAHHRQLGGLTGAIQTHGLVSAPPRGPDSEKRHEVPHELWSTEV